MRAAAYFLLLAIPLLLFSFLYLFFFDNTGYVPFLKKLLLLYGGSCLTVIGVGLLRRRSLLESIWAKRLLRTLYAAAALSLALLYLLLFAGSQLGKAGTYSLTTPFFRDKHVMVIVPHQDDETSLAGGLLEQYIQNGSRVTLVYATNGDFKGLQDFRCKEALKVAASAGIGPEDVYFLGYGDQWKPQEHGGTTVTHLYNSPNGDALWTSAHGSTRTYGPADLACYVQNDYTRNNFLRNLTDLIMSHRPDVIYCSDYDRHVDHKALDLFFEECMANILREQEDYNPVVYKGFCYVTSWLNKSDFCDSLNLLSTNFTDNLLWQNTGTSYRWAERIRLPVSSGNLSRMISDTGMYRALTLHKTQYAFNYGANVVNGDKIFWPRSTNSLLYRADFFADGEQVFLWNDFKLKDCRDLSVEAAPIDGFRGAGSIEVVANSPVTMDSIWLYDNPSPSDNILGGCIEFDDGTLVDFGPLNSDGSPTRISFPARTTGFFRIRIAQTEGLCPGLTEIEAYLNEPVPSTAPAQILMAVDQSDNFVYDHWVPAGEYADFSLYTYPFDSSLSWDCLDISLAGDPQCRYELTPEGLLRVHCPAGAETTVTISYGGEISTTFSVSNPGAGFRWITEKLMVLDHCYVSARDFLLAHSTVKLAQFLN